MAKPKLSLEQSDKKYGGYYRLLLPKKTLFGHLKKFALDLILWTLD